MRLTFFIFLCGWRCIGWGRNQSQLWCKGWNCREIANFITPEVQLHLQVVTVPRKNEKRFCRRRHWTETPCLTFLPSHRGRYFFPKELFQPVQTHGGLEQNQPGWPLPFKYVRRYCLKTAAELIGPSVNFCSESKRIACTFTLCPH